MDPDDFRKIRKAAGLTQGKLAERLGVSRLTVCNWEGAKFRIPDDILDTLAEKGIGTVPTVAKPKNAALTRDTIKYYGEMRRDGITHADIVDLWHRKAFAPSPEAQAGILAEWPDIIQPKGE